MKEFIIKNGEKLRIGYTTGSCAAAAAAAASMMLFSGQLVRKSTIRTPRGDNLTLEISDTVIADDFASCCVIKDSGDDPDVTNGIPIYAKITKCEGDNIVVKGGEGIGIVRQKGLKVPVGDYAINPAPRSMIESEILKVREVFGYTGGICCEIYTPDGKRIAEKTFNPRLGIEGGISILGTTGIVEPMSENALKETLLIELDVLKEKGYKKILLLPGNYAEEFCRETLTINLKSYIKYGNYTGYMLDMAAKRGFTDILMIGHIGKLIKNAGGIMQTHSDIGDARMEIFSCYAALCGIDLPVLERIMKCVTLDAAIEIIEQTGKKSILMQMLAESVVTKAEERIQNKAKVECVLFSQKYGMLSMSKGAYRMIKEFGGEYYDS